jgi:hypothetical protein
VALALRVVKSCSPLNDSDGNWISDICDDEFKLSLDSARYQTINVPQPIYQQFATGDPLQINWDEGKLGFWHNVQYCQPKIDQLPLTGINK